MKKPLLLSVVSLGLIFSAACGAGDDAEETTADGEDNDEEVETEEDEEEEEESEEVEEDEDEEEETADNGDRPTYTVATDNNYIPFEFIEDDELVGFDIDLINAIADEAEFDIEIEQMEFSGIVAAIPSGSFDMGIAGMTITEERQENIDFSQPYYQAGLVLAIQDGNEEIQSIDDVDGMTVATRVGSTSEDYLGENTDADIEAFPEIAEAYQAVLTDRADAVLYDLPNVQYYSETETGGELQIVGDTLTGEFYGIAFPPESELRDEVDEAIDNLQEDGTFEEIYDEWFGGSPDMDALDEAREDLAANGDNGEADDEAEEEDADEEGEDEGEDGSDEEDTDEDDDEDDE
ncbi:transporter substrate-binding domain-containing protein [Salsuginibacillus kocurii]|uniref:transporter substrate-binding domain-containing protein n=1 Tax=Salsuginibacillus kocurii TaxID=427078 RepID=UPI000381E558|nr:transporter substrate-binding domain-containing protein [Salsuginibacillus kocurii]